MFGLIGRDIVACYLLCLLTSIATCTSFSATALFATSVHTLPERLRCRAPCRLE